MKKSLLCCILFAFIVIPLGSFSQTILVDENFDADSVNTFLTISHPVFQTWTNSPGGTDDVKISDEQAASLPNSVKFFSTSFQGDGDIILKLDDKTSGHYQLEFKIFIGTQPTDGGYFNMLHLMPAAAEWAFSLTFDPNLDINFNYNNVLTTLGTYVKGTWLEMVVNVNLNTDTAWMSIDGVQVNQWQWSIQEAGGAGAKQLAGVDFFTYAGGATGTTVLYYIDDVKFTHITYAGIKEPQKIEWVSVYPNPASDIITLDAANANEVELINMHGQSVGFLPVYQSKVDISNLSSGIYIARIFTGDGVKHTRIVKR